MRNLDNDEALGVGTYMAVVGREEDQLHYSKATPIESILGGDGRITLTWSLLEPLSQNFRYPWFADGLAVREYRSTEVSFSEVRTDFSSLSMILPGWKKLNIPATTNMSAASKT